MQKRFLFLTLGALSLFVLNSAALAETYDSSLKKTIEGIALKTLAHSFSLRAPRSIQLPPAAQYTETEWQEKLINLLVEEKLTGEFAYQYLSILVQNKSLVQNRAEQIKSLLPSLKLNQNQIDSVLFHLSQQNFAEDSNKTLNSEANAPAFNLGMIFAELRKSFSTLPHFKGLKHELLGATDLVQEMILGKIDTNDCYENSPSCMYGSNEGLIQYEGRELKRDHSLILDTLRFSLRITLLNQNDHHSGDFSIFDDAAKYNIWKIALDSSAQNPDRAMQVINVFGHDVCCNGIGAFIPNSQLAMDLLNMFHPNSGSDSDPSSHLFVEGALNGVKISRRLERKFKKLNERYHALNGKDAYFRAGYYHVYGGMLTARELLSHGYGYKDGIKFSSMISEMMGYFYKHFTLELFMDEDTKSLWTLSNEDENHLTTILPEGWTQDRFEKAHLNLEIATAMLELTQEQHRQGAEFAYRVYTHLRTK